MGENFLLTVTELLEATNGTVYGIREKDFQNIGCTSVATDTRNVTENSLFVPLIGEKQDGHNYVQKAKELGASIIFISKSSVSTFQDVYDSVNSDGVVLILVENTLHALQKAAAMYVKKFPLLKKIAITGSNGKTTLKECVGSVLAQKYTVIMNVGNLNSETGLPLSMFTIRKEHEVGIFEMGMNRRGEIKELADVFFPDVALITNIGTAHIGILGTKDVIAEEKKQIFANFTSSSVGYVFEDDDYVDFLKQGVNGSIRTYGRKSIDGITKVQKNGLMGSFITYNDSIINFPLVGEHNVNNALGAICVGKHFNVSTSDIKKGLESVKPLFGRSEILHGKPTIIQDCYNGSYESMSASLDFFNQLDWNGGKIAILGDMLELGDKSYELHEKALNMAFTSEIDTILLVGSAFTEVYNSSLYASEGKTVYCTGKTDDDSISRFAITMNSIISDKDIILVKGSRGIRLERLIEQLQVKEVKHDK